MSEKIQRKLTLILPEEEYRLLSIHALDTNQYLVEVIKGWIRYHLGSKVEKKGKKNV